MKMQTEGSFRCLNRQGCICPVRSRRWLTITALCNVKDINDSYNKQLHIEEMTKAAELSEAIERRLFRPTRQLPKTLCLWHSIISKKFWGLQSELSMPDSKTI